MALDFTEYFKKYEAIVADVDAVFKKFENDMPDLVRCGKGCSDCCYALFDVTLVEAMYINAKFNEKFSGLERSAILNRADAADRQIYKLKRKVFKASQEGQPTNDILLEVAKARVRCPLLDDNDLCSIYENRPITCRLYGVPTSIGGEAHTCNKAGFKGGEKYPTVNMDIVLDKLLAIGKELRVGIGSRFKELGEMLLPVSMAIVTEYDEQYLGVEALKSPFVQTSPDEQEQPKEIIAPDAPKSAACATCTESKSSCESCGESIVLGGKD
ncbi:MULTISPECIES: YkgJ family cysteine cluster protein [unclassified Pseudodesulfovibrio]|uniref:YkgJ family cysteine cluster protein n=1 Tax=unclassified Pseudodesulfovibrio TaxID=2661612 RepID=UPI000FEC0F6A|nr:MULTISPECIES: YkgJ family cysteine cluster protein [unclassified Pseudodesulfovibrio]MCJ2166224.1 YkgJ family cysteine cluster protein [Pseudodesulfovibrio sp. S3-i]RWU02312.1 YkgJ family cysteine cluster protein [Pseudodesulfovibrio sp. S3]